MKKYKITCIALVVGVLLAIAYVIVKPSPEIAFETFLTSTNRAEDQLKDPLILAGKNVVPLVLEHIKKKDAVRRLYAISFLGSIRSRESLPILEQIFNDASEGNFRAYSLQAIAQIDLEYGKKLAHTVRADIDNEFLQLIAKEVIDENQELLERRSYWDALTWKHE